VQLQETTTTTSNSLTRVPPNDKLQKSTWRDELKLKIQDDFKGQPLGEHFEEISRADQCLERFVGDH